MSETTKWTKRIQTSVWVDIVIGIMILCLPYLVNWTYNLARYSMWVSIFLMYIYGIHLIIKWKHRTKVYYVIPFFFLGLTFGKHIQAQQINTQPESTITLADAKSTIRPGTVYVLYAPECPACRANHAELVKAVAWYNGTHPQQVRWMTYKDNPDELQLELSQFLTHKGSIITVNRDGLIDTYMYAQFKDGKPVKFTAHALYKNIQQLDPDKQDPRIQVNLVSR